MTLTEFLLIAEQHAIAQTQLRNATIASHDCLDKQSAEAFDRAELNAAIAEEKLKKAYDGLSDAACAIVRAQFGEACSVSEWAEKVF